MKKKNKHSNYFTTKNYIYAALSILAILFLIWYILSWYVVKQKEKLMSSYLITSNTITYEIQNINEMVQILSESPNQYFIYISHNNNEDIYRLEKKLKKVIDSYSLQDEFYYINITDILENKDLYNNLNDTFNTTKITNVPCILFFQNGEIKEIIMDQESVFNVNDLKDLLNKYEYEQISQ